MWAIDRFFFAPARALLMLRLAALTCFAVAMALLAFGDRLEGVSARARVGVAVRAWLLDTNPAGAVRIGAREHCARGVVVHVRSSGFGQGAAEIAPTRRPVCSGLQWVAMSAWLTKPTMRSPSITGNRRT